MVDFFEQHYFKLYEIFQKRENNNYNLYRLMFTCRSGIGCFDLLTSERVIEIFNHLCCQFAEEVPEALTSLACEVLKKILSSKELLKKLRFGTYETLPIFNLISKCSMEAYFEMIQRLLTSHIGKEYAKYSGKIMSLIAGRLEKEYLNCIRAGTKISPTIPMLLGVIKDLLNVKGVLDEEYMAVEPELAKLFLYLQAPEKIEFGSEIYEIASVILRKAGTHLSILDPVVLTFEESFHKNDGDLTDLYPILYSYILKDSSFVRYEESEGSGLQQGICPTTGFLVKPMQHSMAKNGNTVSPFKIINRILLTSLSSFANRGVGHMLENFKMTLLLVILEFQIYNSKPMYPVFKDVLELLILIQAQTEGLFEAASGETKPQITIIYIWVTLSVLNALHYYYEEVMPPLKNTTFLVHYINKGLSLVTPVVASLPKFLRLIHSISCTRMIACAKEIGIAKERVLDLIIAVTNSLSPPLRIEESFNAEEEAALIGKKIDKKQKSKKGFSGIRHKEAPMYQPVIAGLVSEASECSRLAPQSPEHEDMDFYICGVNVYSFFQRIFKELIEVEPLFSGYIKSQLDSHLVDSLNDVLTARVELRPTNLVHTGTGVHDFKEVPAEPLAPRKFAKVRRDPGGTLQRPVQ